jgi:hypothetical protein
VTRASKRGEAKATPLGRMGRRGWGVALASPLGGVRGWGWGVALASPLFLGSRP